MILPFMKGVSICQSLFQKIQVTLYGSFGRWGLVEEIKKLWAGSGK
jgi:hypothetical protein